MRQVAVTADLTLAVALSAGLMAMAACPATAAEDTLGRLFFTPERRQQLDYQREMNILDKQELPADPVLTIDGIVTRSSGRRTAWVNGNPQHENEQWNDLAITPRRGDPGKVLVEGGDSPAARASVGQTVNRNTGEAIDLLHGGQVRVHSRPAGTK
ncbi:hypothetical protein [Accumulibacter sp.]|uniref:hypothetical protein n=1 Tax=Accumulibacter sp. TaxID=2053492 RepID=UPI0028C3B938|nr:hypothetical protein [Accumulibacter sp.]